MRKIVPVYIILSLTVFSCKNSSKTTTSEITSEITSNETVIEFDIFEPAIITGKILNRDIYPLTKDVIMTIQDYNGLQDQYTYTIDDKGEFKFVFYPKTRRNIKILPIEDIIIIAPGDSLHIIKDFKDIINTEFSGTCAKLNKEISKFNSSVYLGRYNIDGNHTDISNSQMKMKADKSKEEYIKRAYEFAEKTDASEDFIIWMKKVIELDYTKAVIEHQVQRQSFGLEQINDADYNFLISEVEKSFTNDLFLTQHIDIASNINQLLINKLYTANRRKIVSAEYLESLDSFITQSNNNYLSQIILYSAIFSNFKVNSIGFFTENRDFIEEHLTDPYLSAIVKERYNRVASYLRNPKIVSDGILNDGKSDLSGSGVNIVSDHNLVKRIINEFPGKVLYIDIWAQWCAPCIYYKQFSKDLMEEFKDQEIEFIYICLSDEEEARKYIKETGLAGRHYFPNEQERRDIDKRFKMNSIPKYFLVNREGYLVDFGIHLNPMNPEVKKKIVHYLEQQ